MPLLLPGLIVSLIAVLIVAFKNRRPAPRTTAAESNAHTQLRQTRAIAAIAGIATWFICASFMGALGRGLLVAPAVAGAVTMCTLAMGENALSTQRSDIRTASLTPRIPSAWIAPRTRAIGMTSMACLTAVLLLAGFTAQPDDQGRAGRAVEWSTHKGSQGGGPWPGLFYSLPASIALIIMLCAFATAMRGVANRPQLNADTRAQLDDDRLRAHSAHILQCVFLLALGFTLAGLSMTMFSATTYAPSGSPTWVTLAHWLGLTGVFVGVITCVTGIALGVKR